MERKAWDSQYFKNKFMKEGATDSFLRKKLILKEYKYTLGWVYGGISNTSLS